MFLLPDALITMPVLSLMRGFRCRPRSEKRTRSFGLKCITNNDRPDRRSAPHHFFRSGAAQIRSRELILQICASYVLNGIIAQDRIVRNSVAGRDRMTENRLCRDAALERGAPATRGLHYPIPVQGKWCNTSHTATAGGAVWAGRPTDHTDQDAASLLILKRWAT